MPASLDTLSSEIIDQIVLHLMADKLRKAQYFVSPWPPESKFPRRPRPPGSIARYALISRKWRDAVERYTFQTIQTYSDDFERLKGFIGDKPHRQRYVNDLFYDLDLPIYSTNRRSRFERPHEHKANLVAFRRSFTQLWKELSTWKPEDTAPRGITLVLDAKAPVNRGQDVSSLPEGIGALRWSYPENTLSLQDTSTGKDKDTEHKRPGPNLNLPSVPCITTLILSRGGRRIDPNSINTILRSLPNLRNLDLTLHPIKARHKKQRLMTRQSLARALTTNINKPGYQNLQVLRLTTPEATPTNHNFNIAPNPNLDGDFPRKDYLGRALWHLLRTSLRELYFTGLISPALFGVNPKHPNNAKKPFPFLEILEIETAFTAYDGRWYYTGDPHAVEGEAIDWGRVRRARRWHRASAFGAWIEGNADDETVRSGNSDYGEDYDEGVDGVVDGTTPEHLWRTQPDPKTFNPLLESMINATLRMPKLKMLEFSMPEDEDRMFDFGFKIAYFENGHRVFEIPEGVDGVYYDLGCGVERPRWSIYYGQENRWTEPVEISKVMERRMGRRGRITNVIGDLDGDVFSCCCSQFGDDEEEGGGFDEGRAEEGRLDEGCFGEESDDADADSLGSSMGDLLDQEGYEEEDFLAEDLFYFEEDGW